MQTENETTGERTAYRYSVEGTLSSVRKGTGEAMTQVQENLYDHTGARVQSTQEGATHTYCYADGRMLCDGTGSSAVYYLYAGDTVACGYQGEHAYLYMQDQQGSTYGIVREDGAVANTYRYTDFGETEAVTDTGFDNVLCYSGSVYDKVTGLYYLNARYYDPETANFLSQDTYRGETGDYDQWNLYAYCANDPVDHVDPSGHIRMRLPKGVPKKWKKWIRKIPGKKKHYGRNKYNTKLPKTAAKARKKGYKKSNFIKSVCHQFGVDILKPNKKYVAKDGHKEVVYNNKGNKIVKDPKNIGTYNFGVGGKEHFFMDVIPWFAWGNSKEDTTTKYQRIDTFFLHYPSAVRVSYKVTMRIVRKM